MNNENFKQKVVPTGPFIWVKGVKHGYCSCGREVNETEKECKLCQKELIWDEN